MPNCIICNLPFIPRNQVQKLCGAAACKREQNRNLAVAAKRLKQVQESQEWDKLPDRAGQVECLKCGQEFLSPDRRAIRICKNCKAIAKGIGAWQPQEVWG